MRVFFTGWIVVTAWLVAATALAQSGPRLDAYGDPLPPGAILRLGTTRLQTRGGFAWTPDGKSLITMKSGTVFFWDMDDGHCSQTLSVPLVVDPFYAYGSQLALSRDGKHLVCTDFHGTIAIWNLETYEMVSQPAVDTKKHEENLALAIHPDGKSFITVRSNGEVQIRDMATAEIQRTLKAPEGQFSDVILSALSPDGRTFVIGSTRHRVPRIYLIDLDGEGEATTQELGGSRLFAVDFLADGRLMTTATAKPSEEGPKTGKYPILLQFWDIKQRKLSEETTIDSASSSGCRVIFSGDGRTMVAVHQDRIDVVDTQRHTTVRTIDGLNFWNPAHIQAAIDPLGKRLAVNDRYNFVSVYDLTSGQPLLSTGRHHQGHVPAVAWSPDGKTIATGDSRGEVRLWNSVDGTEVIRFCGPRYGVFALCFSHDGKQIIFCGDEPARIGKATGPVRWFDAATGKKTREYMAHGRARLLTPSPDQSLVALAVQGEVDPFAASEPSLAVIEFQSGKEVLRVQTAAQAEALGWSPDGKSLFACGSAGLMQIDISTGQLVAQHKLEHRYSNPANGIVRIGGPARAAFSRSVAALVTSGADSEIYGWRPQTGEKRWTIKTEAPYFRGLAVSPDECTLAVINSEGDAKRKILRLFDIAMQRELAHFDVGLENCDRLAFSPDSSKIVVGFYNGTALVYDLSLALAKQ
jgi:WD40 repeat protein